MTQHIEDVQEPVTVSVPTTIGGVVTGKVTVVAGGDLAISGIVKGDVDVHDGGSASIRGIMDGALAVAAGAQVDIYGIVNGTLLSNDGTIKVAAGSIINGRRALNDGRLVTGADAEPTDPSNTYILEGLGSEIVLR